MDNNLFKDGVPVGFGMALAESPEAMIVFANLSHDEQQNVLNQAKKADSKADMRSIVRGLINVDM